MRCKHCEKSFTPKQPHGVFCCVNCRVYWHRAQRRTEALKGQIEMKLTVEAQIAQLGKIAPETASRLHSTPLEPDALQTVIRLCLQAFNEGRLYASMAV